MFKTKQSGHKLRTICWMASIDTLNLTFNFTMYLFDYVKPSSVE